MNVSTLLIDAGSLVATASSLAAAVRGLRWYLGYRAERSRWDAVRALTEQHGPAVLDRLPELARELRDQSEPRASITVRRPGRASRRTPGGR